MTRQRVLAVDDERGIRSFYDEFFNSVYKEEFTAWVAKAGGEALELLQARPFDLAVLDWRLPDVSGLEVARAVRRGPGNRDIAILMVTGLSTARDVCEALEAGVDDHLGKPFDEGVLLARLRSLARRRRGGVQ